MTNSQGALFYKIEVPQDQKPERLDLFLVHSELNLTRSQIRRLIKAGNVEVEGRSGAAASLKVRPGNCIKVVVPPPKPSELHAVELDLDVLYEDSHLIVINKPAGLVVHPGAGSESVTLVHGLLYHCKDLSGIGGEERPGIVHRLDRDTSGVMVVAKDNLTHAALSAQFKEGKTRKLYKALVDGRMGTTKGFIDLPIGRHPFNRKKMSTISRSGRPAQTRWELEQELAGASLLSVRIFTGRTHQIRVHLASAGHPVLGDNLYGGKKKIKGISGEELSIERQMLHAFSLSLHHPVLKKEMEFVAPLPNDMKDLIMALSG